MDKIIFNFYSRASCEARQNCTASSPIFKIFLLTRLLRGATEAEDYDIRNDFDFYSRASREARLNTGDDGDNDLDFYSRASREARLR